MLSNANVTLSEMASQLKDLKKCYVIRHLGPDGDAIAAQFAMVLALRVIGVNAQPRHTDPVPEQYRYLTDRIPTEDDIGSAPYIAVDSAKSARLGRYANEPIDLCIDHHENNSINAKYKYVEAGTSSCAQVVLKVIKALGIEITPVIAEFLYIGLITDTNCFRSHSTDRDSLAAAAELATYGIDPSAIARKHRFYKSEKRLAAEGRLMSTLRTTDSGNIISCMLTHEDYEELGVRDDELEGINALIEQIESARLAVVLKEKTPGVCWISVRASKGLNAAEICERFGGGGHAAAAGCDLKGTPKECRKIMERACTEYLREGKL